MNRDELRNYYDGIATQRDRWLRKARYYHRDLVQFHRFVVPPGQSVVELGCGTGDLLAALEPARGLGLDVSPEMIRLARARHPDLAFEVDDLEALQTEETFDYVILSNLIGCLTDVQPALARLHKLTGRRTRIVITYYSRLWQPLLRLAELLRLKMPQPAQNWLSQQDLENLLRLNGFETVRQGVRMLCPVFIPGLSWLLNKVLAHLPGLRHLCLTSYLVARKLPTQRTDHSVTVIVPTKNEAGNVQGVIDRTPGLGTHTEFIFVDGHSTDGTLDRIVEMQARYPDRDIKAMTQSGKGKANAVFEAMDRATGDMLMILDSDLTVPPEELPRFYEAMCEGHGEFINGCRLVYPREKKAMRFLNTIANHAFAVIFTWLIGFRLKDTLCGTKVLSREAYRCLRANMSYFGDFDPFGDFQLIFGAARLCLRVVEIPVHYKARTYGTIQIRRFRDGLLLLRMVFTAVRKIKVQ